MRELGQDVYGFNAAIGLRVDPQDNVWTIDAAASQVVKFDPTGGSRSCSDASRKPSTCGPHSPRRRGGQGEGAAASAGGRRSRRWWWRWRRWRWPRHPGAGTPGSSFSQPTDVAWDRDGQHLRRRRHRHQQPHREVRQGRPLHRALGLDGQRPGQFNGVKALAIDAQDNVYAADAGNKRIQVFDADGTFKSEFGNVGTPRAMCITQGATQYLFVSHAGDEDGMEDAAIYKVPLDGTVVGRFGIGGQAAGSSASRTRSTAAARTSCSSAR